MDNPEYIQIIIESNTKIYISQIESLEKLLFHIIDKFFDSYSSYIIDNKIVLEYFTFNFLKNNLL